jgi:hypothetical protein
MALLVGSRFDEIEQAMRSVDGRYLLRSRCQGVRDIAGRDERSLRRRLHASAPTVST